MPTAKKQLTEKQAKAKFLQLLASNDGEATAPEMVELTGWDKATVNSIAKELHREKKIVSAGDGKVALPPEESDEEEEVAPPKKKAAPAKGKAAAPPAKKKVAPPVEEEEDDEDEEDLIDEEDEEDLDEEVDDDDDEDFDLDDSTDEYDDDEEEEVAPKKKAAPAKGKSGKVTLTAPQKAFTMAFKPIDTLTDDELEERIDISLQAAESLNEDGHVLVSEMLMRSIAKARRQLNKRS